MSHDHQHHHAHAHGKNAPFRVLWISIAIVLSYAAVEAVTGWHAGSLALMGDAGHMVSDALALTIAALAAWIAKKPVSKTHSYGMGRAEVVAAWFSSLLMLFISVAIIVEAVDRIHSPIKVNGTTVMIIAFIGMLINLLVAFILSGRCDLFYWLVSHRSDLINPDWYFNYYFKLSFIT